MSPDNPDKSDAVAEVRSLRERVRLLEERLAASDRSMQAQTESLHQKTRILESILDSMSDGIAVADARGHLRMFNPAAADLLGLGPIDAPPGEWPQRYGFHEADKVTPFPPDRLPLVRAIHGESVDDQELYVSRPGGPEGLWLSINSRPIRDAAGEVTGGVSVLRDVSRRVAAEAALERRTAELLRSNTELEQFAYVASHDLQEPLRLILSYGDLLAKRGRDRLDPGAARFLEEIVGNARRMSDLVADLLALSRVGTSTAVVEACDAGLQCDRALASLRDLIEREGATVTRDELPRLAAVPGQLQQLFQNLIANGVKFHDGAAPVVHVSAERRPPLGVVSVRDQGIGIDPAGLEKIFAMFTRLHTRGEFPGSGIGLAICRRIVERHGGRIWAESSPGRGAIFRFTMPLVEGEAA
ncbi:MAG TPA: ATP-binding protein [Dongiaceae bacterium]|nr:ATP-binding protein [Dongiaceae bacterium]